jgi:vacuolar protein sorting-associated protein 33A
MYLTRPRAELMKLIAKQVKSFKEGEKKFKIYFVPRKTTICDKLLKELGISKDVTVDEYPLDLIPFDCDVLSMELNSSYKDCYLDGDMSSLSDVARSIMTLQAFFGVIPHIKAKGTAASVSKINNQECHGNDIKDEKANKY